MPISREAALAAFEKAQNDSIRGRQVVVGVTPIVAGILDDVFKYMRDVFREEIEKAEKEAENGK